MNNPKGFSELVYTYYFVDGTSSTVCFGEDGVRRKDILRLQEFDHVVAKQERKIMVNTDFKFLNTQRYFERNASEFMDSLIDLMPDDKADIWEILYGEKSEQRNIEALRKAMKRLTRKQRNLIWDLYGMKKKMIDIAKRDHVSEAAIRSRREKILRRLKALLVEKQE